MDVPISSYPPGLSPSGRPPSLLECPNDACPGAELDVDGSVVGRVLWRACIRAECPACDTTGRAAD